MIGASAGTEGCRVGGLAGSAGAIAGVEAGSGTGGVMAGSVGAGAGFGAGGTAVWVQEQVLEMIRPGCSSSYLFLWPKLQTNGRKAAVRCRVFIRRRRQGGLNMEKGCMVALEAEKYLDLP